MTSILGDEYPLVRLSPLKIPKDLQQLVNLGDVPTAKSHPC
jgi:hypothetical protein